MAGFEVTPEVHRDFGLRHPWRYLLVVGGSGGLLILSLVVCEWYAIYKSKEHVVELRKLDSPQPRPQTPVKEMASLPPTNSDKAKTEPTARPRRPPRQKEAKATTATTVPAQPGSIHKTAPPWVPLICSRVPLHPLVNRVDKRRGQSSIMGRLKDISSRNR